MEEGACIGDGGRADECVGGDGEGRGDGGRADG